MSRIFWDTNLFIYLLEDHPEFAQDVVRLRTRMMERGDELVTSAVTLGEVQVKPRERNDVESARRYGKVLRQTCRILSFDADAAEIYAELRASVAIRPPDAIQLSCAAAAGVELFVTNDRGLQRLRVPGIHFIAPLNRVPI